MNAPTTRCRCRAAIGREIAQALDSAADLLDDRYGPSWSGTASRGGRRRTRARDFLSDYAVDDGAEENTAFDAGYVFGLMEAARAVGGRRR